MNTLSRHLRIARSFSTSSPSWAWTGMSRTRGLKVADHIDASLVKAMQMAKTPGSVETAQRVAGDCVVLAETKDHLNWELIGHLATHGKGNATRIMKTVRDTVEHQKDHHLHHTTARTRELWIDSFGLPAASPPPAEVKQVEAAIGASRAEQARGSMLKERT